MKTVFAAALLLVVVAAAAHFVWTMLDPLLPSLLAIALVAMVAFVLLGRRR